MGNEWNSGKLRVGFQALSDSLEVQVQVLTQSRFEAPLTVSAGSSPSPADLTTLPKMLTRAPAGGRGLPPFRPWLASQGTGAGLSAYLALGALFRDRGLCCPVADCSQAGLLRLNPVNTAQ